MGFKAITPVKKAKSSVVKDQEYVRLTNKMLYINSGASKYLDGDYIQIFLDQKRELIKMIPCKKGELNAFKLSKVNETNGARRIETNNALRSFIDAGFPNGKLGKRLPVSKSIDGSLLVDYAWHPIPAQQRDTAALREAGIDA